MTPNAGRIAVWMLAAWTTVELDADLVCAQSLPPTLNGIAIGNQFIRRNFIVRDGVLGTGTLVDFASKQVWLQDATANEFVLELADGRRLGSSAFRVASQQADAQAKVQSLEFKLTCPTIAGLSLRLRYTLAGDASHMTKLLECDAPVEIRKIEIEVLPTTRPTALGGLGQPIFVDDRWYVGVEHPAGVNEFVNGAVRCQQWIGCNGMARITSVLGCRQAVDRSVDDAFRRYLDTVAAPVSPQMQYNSWFDLRGGELTPDALIDRFKEFRRQLLDPYALRFDAFVIDDGFQNPSSLWEFNAAWDQRILPLRDFVERQGSRLGLWLPLSGHMLDTSHGRAQGYAVSDHRKQPYCLASEKYRRDLKIAVDSLVEAGNFAYFKHDFNFLSCTAPGHGHATTVEAGRQANCDGQLAMLDYEKSKRPDLVRSLTSGIWLSPWWLKSAEFLWLGGADYGRRDRFPTSNPRAAEMTFRDIEIHRRLRTERTQAPLHRLMTHGLIRGPYEGMLPTEDLEAWSDYVVWFFARGTMLHELYLTPRDLPEPYWLVLAKAIRWARANAECFRWSRMVGGNPEAGQPYGFVHWTTSKGIVAIRNPTTQPVEFAFDFATRPGHFATIASWRPVMIYPRRSILPTAEHGLNVPLPADSIVVLELYRELPSGLRKLGSDPNAIVDFTLDLPTSAGSSTPAIVETLVGGSVEPVGIVALERDKSKLRVRLRPRFESDADRLELQLIEWPARSCRSNVRDEGGQKSSPLAWRRIQSVDDAPGPRQWSKAVCAMPPRLNGSTVSIDLDLPPTPAFPERTRIALLAVARRPLHSANRIEVAVADLPEWPECIHSRTKTTTTVVFDEIELARRRSPWERALWIVLLAGLPVVVLTVLHHRMATRFQSKLLRALIALFFIAVGAALITWTPLGLMLGRIL